MKSEIHYWDDVFAPVEQLQREIKDRCKRERRRPDLLEGVYLRINSVDKTVDPLSDRAEWRAWLEREEARALADGEPPLYANLRDAMHIHLVATQGQLAATSPRLPAWW